MRLLLELLTMLVARRDDDEVVALRAENARLRQELEASRRLDLYLRRAREGRVVS